jgi:uncharacterized membrane protein
MAQDAPVQVIVAAFADEDAAEKVLDELKDAKKAKMIGIDTAIVMHKDEKGKLHTREYKLTPTKGAIGGAIVGGILGIVTGGAALVVGAAGAGIGALIGKHEKNKRFAPKDITEISDALTPGSSAIVAVIEHKWVQQVEEELEAQGAEVMKAAIAADIAEQLAQGRDVAMSAVATEDSLTTSRVSSGEEGVEMSSTLLTEDVLQHTEAAVTDEGMIGSRTTITEDGMVEGQMAATAEGVVGERLTTTAAGDQMYEALAADEEGADYAAVAQTAAGDVAAVVASVTPEQEDAPALEAETEEGVESDDAAESAEEQDKA